MRDWQGYGELIDADGYAIINNVFDDGEINVLSEMINGSEKSNPSFRQGIELFAIRRFLQEVPGTIPVIFNPSLNSIINSILGNNYFVVKSIYFDKPPMSNWFVAWHQDLSISVRNRHDIPGFENWTKKQRQWAVQPPTYILKNNFTMRIHLDDTDANNGALKVIPGSHKNGIIRPEFIAADKPKEQICIVKKGGIMIMKPLLMHASGRTVNNKRRRVIHIEFSKAILPAPLEWSETIELLR